MIIMQDARIQYVHTQVQDGVFFFFFFSFLHQELLGIIPTNRRDTLACLS
jgi:hypothetical protein